MTKEEIQKVLDLALEYYKLEIFGTGKECFHPTQERIDWIYERMNAENQNNHEGLDEAAEEYYDEMWDELGGVAMVRNNEHDIWYPSEVIETVFKAGAEWAFGQGETFDGMIRRI